MKIGAQLYSLRNYMARPELLDTTFDLVKKMGYQCVQLSGFPCVKEDGAGFDVDFINSLIDKYGLEVNLTHIGGDRLENQLDKVIADHKAIGCDSIGLGGMPGAWGADDRFTLDFTKRFVEKYNPIAKKIKDAGLNFSYHNHQFEFLKMENGQTIMDYLIENCPDFNFTLDTHWVQRGGVSIVSYINKLKGRIKTVHLKEYTVDRTNINNCKFVPIGDGVIDWVEVVNAFEANGAEYAFVEQDDATNFPDAFGQMEKSIKHLISLGLVK